MSRTDRLSDVLVFTRTTAYRHDSIPAGQAALRELGEEHGFTVETSEDPSVFTDASLAGRGAVVFLSTSGDVLTPDGRAALRRWTSDGGGFMGIHAAACTEYDWPYYGELLGARFMRPPGIPVRHRAGGGPEPSGDAPSAAAMALERRVVRLPEQSAAPRRTGPRHHRRSRLTREAPWAPITPWCGARSPAAGRSFYTSLGHADDAYTDPAFRGHLLGGLRWAAG